MIAKIPIGAETLAVDMRGLKVFDLSPQLPARLEPTSQRLNALIERQHAGHTLEKALPKSKKILILVPDVTRKLGLPAILGYLTPKLEGKEVTVLVACGTHPQAPERRLALHLGPVPKQWKVIQHNSKAKEDLVPVGKLRPNGQEVALHKLLFEHDLLISISVVQHHYFAGFGGGPKMIFPGVANYEAIQANHSLVVDLSTTPPTVNPNCAPGKLDGNPIWEEMAEAAKRKTPDFQICIVPGKGLTPSAVTAGPFWESFKEAVAFAKESFEVEAPKFRLMVASGGGAPIDLTLIQAHKAMEAACRFLEPGGELLFVASLEDGTGSPDMEPFIGSGNVSAVISLLKERYVQYGHTAFRLMDKASRFRITVMSKGLKKELEACGFKTTENPQAVVDNWRRRFSGEPVGVMVKGTVWPAANRSQASS